MGAENLESSTRGDPPSAQPIEPRKPANDSHVTVGHDFNKESNSAADEREGDFEGGGVTRPILALIVATVVLFWQGYLVANRDGVNSGGGLQSDCQPAGNVGGRFVSAALVVALGITAIGVVGLFLTVELTSVAVEVAGYSDNIAAKLARLQGSTPAWLRPSKMASRTSSNGCRKQLPRPTGRAPQIVQAQVVPPAMAEVLKPAWPILAGFGKALLIIVLLFFLLYARRDLRDRLIRLAARARIPVAVEAIETATAAVGRYLLLLSLTNLVFGIAIGIASWLLGLPHAALWGALAFVLRFIPYVGALGSGVLPTLVAFAVFPGWSRSLRCWDASSSWIRWQIA